MNASTASSSSLGLRAGALGDRAVGLHHQPGGAEQRIAGDHAEPAQQRERRRPVERPPAKAPFSTLMPWISPPRITPWQNAASVEPPAKAKFQYVLLVVGDRSGIRTRRRGRPAPAASR